MTKHYQTNRRRLLKRMGASCLALPFYEALTGTNHAAAACGSGNARRVLIFYTPNGFQGDAWWMGNGMTMGDSLSPLANHTSKINYFANLRSIHEGAQGHPDGVRAALTGNMDGNNESVDVAIHNWIRNSDPGHRHLYLGTALPATMNSDHYISYYGSGYQINNSILGSPRAAWQSVFGANSGSSGESQSIIDLHKAELDDLRYKLGTAEQRKLDRHLESIRDIESRLSVSVNGCSILQQPTIDDYNMNEVDVVPAATQLQMDIALAAMRCGLSRVVTYQFGFHTTDMNVKFPGSEMDANPDNRREYHGASHDYGGIFSQMKKWEMARLAGMLDELANTPEPDSSCSGSMLDNTIVYVLSEIGNGSSHDYSDMRHLLIGGAGGAWSTNRIIDAGGQRHSRILVSIANAMGYGINPGFGGWGSGGMPGL